MKHLYFFLIVSFCSSLLSCTNDDSFLAHDFETQQNRALSIYTGNYNIYQIAKKVSLPSASFNTTSSFPNFTAVESGYNNISLWQFAQDFKESSPSPYKDYVMSNVLVAKLIDIIGNNFGKNTKSIALASSKNSTILPQSFKYKGKTFIVKENIIKNAQNKISFANIAVSSTLKINKCIPVDSIVRQVFSKERIKYLAERNEKIICLTVFDGQSGKIEEVSFSLTFAPDITEKEIFNLEQIIKNQLFSFEDTNTQEHYRFVQAIDFTLLNK